MADPHQMFSGLGDVPVVEEAPQAEQGGGGFFRRLVDGLSKSSKALTGQIQSIAFDPDDAEAWEQLEEALLCLHLDLLPKDRLLQKLPSQDWNLLHELLVMLFREKEQSSLH